MTRRIIAPILLLISGVGHLFYGSLRSLLNIGYDPATLQRLIGVVSVVLAIGLLSALSFSKNGREEK